MSIQGSTQISSSLVFSQPLPSSSPPGPSAAIYSIASQALAPPEI